jgi:hypothetical protein
MGDEEVPCSNMAESNVVGTDLVLVWSFRLIALRRARYTPPLRI